MGTGFATNKHTCNSLIIDLGNTSCLFAVRPSYKPLISYRHISIFNDTSMAMEKSWFKMFLRVRSVKCCLGNRAIRLNISTYTDTYIVDIKSILFPERKSWKFGYIPIIKCWFICSACGAVDSHALKNINVNDIYRHIDIVNGTWQLSSINSFCLNMYMACVTDKCSDISKSLAQSVLIYVTIYIIILKVSYPKSSCYLSHYIMSWDTFCLYSLALLASIIQYA